MFEHNDYEIINLINEGNTEALSLLFEKYTPLIYKKIDIFNLNYDREDMFQEGLMMLLKSLRTYKPFLTKTFTRYFEMNLDRKYISIIKQSVRRKEIFMKNIHYIHESENEKGENSIYFDYYMKELQKILTKTEFLVYTLRELQNFSISYISKEFELDDKVIYNSLYRAKSKIKDHFGE